MRIRHVKIKNFRGISHLDWKVTSDFVCLIGAGDSGKTTILDGISYALTPRWTIPITDADFRGANPDQPIEIEVTIIDPPAELLPEEPKFGLFLRGWSPASELHDDPEEGDSLALTIRFTVDSALEPEWLVVKDAVPDGKPIRSGDREKLKVFRVDEHSDRHLGWGRGSALAALTGDLDELPATLAAAHRLARQAFTERAPDRLREVAATAHRGARELGVAAPEVFEPALAPEAISRRSALVLSSAGVPATGLGLGSRRLTALAVQEAQLSTGSVVIVDEVEHALEPHRLRHLLNRLKKAVRTDDAADGPSFGQVFLSTHSPLTLEELKAGDLHVVRPGETCLQVTRVPDAFDDEAHVPAQALVRSGAEALLARRIVVGEGKTEVGVFRALAVHWAKERHLSLAHLGTVPMVGGGGSAPGRAVGFARLGYPTALLLDSDTVLSSELEGVAAAGVAIVQWAGSCAIEERFALDLPAQGFHEMVCLAVEYLGTDAATSAIPDRMAQHFPPGTERLQGLDSNAWLEIDGIEVEDLRRAFGRAAHNGGWFKMIERGEELGALVAEHLAGMEGTDSATKIKTLEKFSYGDI
jgi:hypothetical protein